MIQNIRLALTAALNSAYSSLESWHTQVSKRSAKSDKHRLITAQDKRERKNALRLKHRVQ